MRRGFAELPLHGGQCPPWLFSRMKRLGGAILEAIVSLFGPEEVLRRVSDPVFFQSLGCLLGFDWHSSGLTTTLCGALKEGIWGKEDTLGVYICGGKGRTSRKTPEEILAHAERNSFSFGNLLVQYSKLSAKVDNTALQDGYTLYHHVFFFTSFGSWSVVQQGMNLDTRLARRYHWWGEQVEDFVCEPHTGICGARREVNVLNLVARESTPCRAGIMEIIRHPPRAVVKEIAQIKSLLLPRRHSIYPEDFNLKRIEKVIWSVHERKPVQFVELLGVPGIGPKTLRALALTAEIILGTPASFRDPVSFSFAHGGKDGIPFPVDRKTYDATIDFLGNLVEHSRIGIEEKKKMSKQLKLFVL